MKSAFDHEDLRVYQEAIGFVAWLEEVKPEKNWNVSACDHLGRASAGIPVNIAQASGKSSKGERCHYIDTAYGSSLECAACLDVLCILEFLSAEAVQAGKKRLSALVSMLIGFRKSTGREVREKRAPYLADGDEGSQVCFDHEKLNVYRKALVFVAWCSQFWNNHSVPRSTVRSLDRASTSVALNIAEGNGKFSSKDRCRFISHARTAALQAAATLDVHSIRQTTATQDAVEGKIHLTDIVRMLIAWEKSLERR